VQARARRKSSEVIDDIKRIPVKKLIITQAKKELSAAALQIISDRFPVEG
jgi:hypothetical protein